LLPGAGSHLALGAKGGSHLPSEVTMPCRGVAVGTGVLVGLGMVGVAVGRGGVMSTAVWVAASTNSVGNVVGVSVAVAVGVGVGV
jgi:F0F1-type ATP synthase membrane subunit c/vacuolar-type H+-ATPase subunit K